MNPKDQIHYDIAELLEKIAHLNIKLAGMAKIHPVELDLLRTYLRELDKLADSMPLMTLPKPTFGFPQQEAQPSTLPSFNTPEEAPAATEPIEKGQDPAPEETFAPIDRTAQPEESADTAPEPEPERTDEQEVTLAWNPPQEPETAEEPLDQNDVTVAEDTTEPEPENTNELEPTMAWNTPQEPETAEEQLDLDPLESEENPTEPEEETFEIEEPTAEEIPTEAGAEPLFSPAFEEEENKNGPETPAEPEVEPWTLEMPDTKQAEEPTETPAYREPWVDETDAEPAAADEEPAQEEPQSSEPLFTQPEPPTDTKPSSAPNTEEPVKRSLNDMFQRSESQDLGSRFQFQNRRNLREMIDLSERYVFTKELFGGDTDYYDRAIRQLNQFETLAEAQAYMQNELRPKYNWETKEQVEAQFTRIVERRFA